MIWLFLKALLIGLAIAAPLGPIGALCIQRSLAFGFAAGVAGGFGTALADALYAGMAAGGFAAFSGSVARLAGPLGAVGGIFLLWLAVRSWPRQPVAALAGASPHRGSLWATTASTFALTIINPATILSFAAIFAGLGIARTASLNAAIVLVSGVFVGSMLWWLILSGATAFARKRLPAAFSLWVGRASSLLMAGFGIWALQNALV